jgi:glycosyltransferase involved in cell wall biosynthesis
MTGIAISAVIPCLNEARTLGACIEKAQAAFARLDMAGEVVVADNGSTDASADIAARLGARVVFQPLRGYGAALQKGIEEARGRIIVMAMATTPMTGRISLRS